MVDLTPVAHAGQWLAGATALRAFLAKVLGPAADELAGIIADPIADYRKELNERRAKRFLKIVADAEAKVEKTGREPERIPDYIAVPLIESATLIDDETLQGMWAGLMASASDPASRDGVHPSFSGILKALSPVLATT
jgi:hypothetical protein